MKKAKKHIFMKKGFVLLFALGILAVLFIVVFAVAGLATNSRIQSTISANKKLVSSESENFAALAFAAIKSGAAPVLEQKAKNNPEILSKAELINAEANAPIYTDKGLKFKTGDRLLNIRTSYHNTQLVMDMIYLLNFDRAKAILISAKVSK